MRKLVGLAFIMIVSMSCGIDTISYLSGNPRSYSATDTALVFYGPATPYDTSYLGIDIFYKIYASDTDADADLASLTARQSATDAVPGYSVSSYLLSSSGLAYSKPLLNASIPIPQLPVANLPSTDYAEIDFPTMTTEPTISFPSSGPTSYELRRAISSGGTYVSFNTKPVAGDADFKSNSLDTDETTFYVQFFAASFGIDFASGGITELYGDAVYLGRIALNFF
ncbi:MAG TPA: hypothetical protein VMX33_11190 [bacterium]|nr:hypothetical protein [bacterium]